MIEIRERLASVETEIENLKSDFQEIKDLIRAGGKDIKEAMDAQNVKIERLCSFIGHWKSVGIVFMTLGAAVTYIFDRYEHLSSWLRKTL